MCNFFSFLTDGDHKLYYFSGDDRRKRVKFRDGQDVASYDSHTSIARYYGISEDDWSKGEYNPYTDKLTLDQQQTTWDEGRVRNMLAGVDWRGLCGDLKGARAFLRELKDIPWFKPDGTLHDGDGIKLFETWDAARAAAWNAAWDAARDDAWNAAGDAAWNAAGDAAGNAAGDAAGDAAFHAALDAAGDAAWDAVGDAALHIRAIHIFDGLPIAQEHIDHARKRMDVWRHGYGVWCDVDGVMYCYERI